MWLSVCRCSFQVPWKIGSETVFPKSDLHNNRAKVKRLYLTSGGSTSGRAVGGMELSAHQAAIACYIYIYICWTIFGGGGTLFETDLFPQLIGDPWCKRSLVMFLLCKVGTKHPFERRGRLFASYVVTENTSSWAVWERWGDTHGVFAWKLMQFVFEFFFICTLPLTYVRATALCFGLFQLCWKLSPWSLKDVPHGNVPVLLFHWWLLRWGFAPGFFMQQWGFAPQTPANIIWF